MSHSVAVRHSGRFMWLTPDRVFYVGLLGSPGERTMGSVNVYVAAPGADLALELGEGPTQRGQLAVVQPYVAHRVTSGARLIHVLQVEAETVDSAQLAQPLAASGVVDDPAFVARVHGLAADPRARAGGGAFARADFDRVVFGAQLPPRGVDPRIRRVIDAIKRDPAAPVSAQSCAQSVNLSFSRFLHLFREEVGVPFRAFRTWKRARSLLHHVNRDANLAHVALDTGYPDSTHFSRSIRQVYGLRPRDIFAGSRHLAIYAAEALPAQAGIVPSMAG